MKKQSAKLMAKNLLKRSLAGDSLSGCLLLAIMLGPINRRPLLQYASDLRRPLLLRQIAAQLAKEVKE